MNTKVLIESMERCLDDARKQFAAYQQVPIPLCELSRLVGSVTAIQMACEYDGLSATSPLYTIWKQAKELHSAFRDVLTCEYERYNVDQKKHYCEYIEECDEETSNWKRRYKE